MDSLHRKALGRVEYVWVANSGTYLSEFHQTLKDLWKGVEMELKHWL